MSAEYQRIWLRLDVLAGLTAAGRVLGHGRIFVNLAPVREAHRASVEAPAGNIEKIQTKA